MVRAAALLSIASACVACRPSAPATPAATTEPASSEPAPPRQAPSGLDALHEVYSTDVFEIAAVAVPGGKVVAYRYDRLESEIGRLTAEGRDVAAELAAEEQRCEAERAALDPNQREVIESMEPSCEELAGAAVFSDDQLTTGCEVLGVAYLGARDELLDHLDFGDDCLDHVHTLDAYDLSPAPGDELRLVAAFVTYGETTRGGWGNTKSVERLHVLRAATNEGEDEGEGEASLVVELEVKLDEKGDGGACDVGTRRSLRVVTPGVLERFSQEYRDCGNYCIEPSDEDAQDAEPDELCRHEPIEAERATWQPADGSWEEFEPFDFDGDVMPEDDP
jgi:hypothetical protein